MDKRSFSCIVKRHKEIAEVIISKGGSCLGIDCKDCPFSHQNSVDNVNCVEGYGLYTPKDTLKACKEFLELCGKEIKVRAKLNKNYKYYNGSIYTVVDIIKDFKTYEDVVVLVGEGGKFSIPMREFDKVLVDYKFRKHNKMLFEEV